MSDTEEVKTFIPQIHPEIAQMRERGEFVFSNYELGKQADDPDYFFTQEWADRIKKAINLGIFEVTGGMQTIPEGLIHLEPGTEVVLRYAKVDQLMTAENALSIIKEVVERQGKGHFEFSEAAVILSEVSGDSCENISNEINHAFDDGKLIFYRNGSPVRPLPDEQIPQLCYGEYTAPDHINRWLEDWGAQYRFPKNEKATSISITENQTPSSAKPVQRSQAQDAAILTAIHDAGHNPLALTKNAPGKSGVKAEIRAKLKYSSLFVGKYVFDKAWERLTRNGDIVLHDK